MKIPVEIDFINSAFQAQKTTDARMDGQVSIITGATSGVGYHAARRLARGGASLVLVCRNGAKAEELRKELFQTYNSKAEIVLADFSRLSEVRKAADFMITFPGGRLGAPAK